MICMVAPAAYLYRYLLSKSAHFQTHTEQAACMMRCDAIEQGRYHFCPDSFGLHLPARAAWHIERPLEADDLQLYATADERMLLRMQENGARQSAMQPCLRPSFTAQCSTDRGMPKCWDQVLVNMPEGLRGMVDAMHAHELQADIAQQSELRHSRLGAVMPDLSLLISARGLTGRLHGRFC